MLTKNAIDIGPLLDIPPVSEFVLTIEDDYKSPRKLYKYMSLFFGSLIALTNLSVVIGSGLILKKAVHPKSTYMLLGNISLADTIIGIVLIFNAFFDEFIRNAIDSNDNRMHINALCIFIQEFRSCAVVVSVLSIGAIAIDRYLYIMHGMYYKSWINTRRIKVTILGIWIIGITITTPAWLNISTVEKCYFMFVFTKEQVIIMITGIITVITAVTILHAIILVKAIVTRRKIKSAIQLSKEQILYMKKDRNIKHNNTKMEKKINKTKPKTEKVDVKCLQSNSRFGAIGKTFSQPNIKLASHFLQKSRSFEQFSNSSTSSEKDNQKVKPNTISETIEINIRFHPQKKQTNKRGIVLVLLTTCSFIVLWTPFIIVTVYFKFICLKTNLLKDCTQSYRKLFRPMSALALCNSLVNPILYAWWHKKYTEHIKKFYTKYCKST